MLPREGFDGAAPHLRRGRAPVRMGAIGQGLGDVDAPHMLFAVEIGERAPDLQHAMETAGGKAHGVGGVADESQALRIGLRHLLQERRRAGGIGGDSSAPQFPETPYKRTGSAEG